MKKLTVALLALLLAAPAFSAEVLPMISAADSDSATRIAENAELYTWLTSFEGWEKAAPFEVRVPAADLAALRADEPKGGALWIGVKADVGVTVDLAQGSRATS